MLQLFFSMEFQDVVSYPRLGDMRFQLFYLLSVSQGFLLNLCIFRCTTINSPLTTNNPILSHFYGLQ